LLACRAALPAQAGETAALRRRVSGACMPHAAAGSCARCGIHALARCDTARARNRFAFAGPAPQVVSVPPRRRGKLQRESTIIPEPPTIVVVM
jgi:hypothetical protein